MNMNQHQHLHHSLAEAWDIVYNHLHHRYDFSSIRKVFADDVTIGTARNPACYYDGNIVVDPSVFTFKQWESDYTGITSDNPLLFILLHEFAHHLQQTKQITLSTDAEQQADMFAQSVLKEMHD